MAPLRALLETVVSGYALPFLDRPDLGLTLSPSLLDRPPHPFLCHPVPLFHRRLFDLRCQFLVLHLRHVPHATETNLPRLPRRAPSPVTARRLGQEHRFRRRLCRDHRDGGVYWVEDAQDQGHTA